MSSVRIGLSGDQEQILQRLRRLENIETRGALNSIAEGLRTSTVRRFQSGTAPDGSSWEPSIRSREQGGQTLDDTSALRNGINTNVNNKGLAIGTNDIRAATHQFGDSRTIRAKNGKYLVFRIGGQWRRVTSVTINIPARPFLGISEDDEKDIQELIEELIEE